jgi:hypothetical protein
MERKGNGADSAAVGQLQAISVKQVKLLPIKAGLLDLQAKVFVDAT